MSMICSLYRASDECIAYLASDEEAARFFFHGPLPPTHQPLTFGRVLAKLFGRATAPEPPPPPPIELPYPRNDGDECYIGTQWHGLHYILTESHWDDVGPLSVFVAVESGTPITIPRDNYGGPIGFSSSFVKKLNSALGSISKLELELRFDPTRMNEEQIYAFGWDSPDALEGLLGAFDEFRDFVAQAAAANDGLIRLIE